MHGLSRLLTLLFALIILEGTPANALQDLPKRSSSPAETPVYVVVDVEGSLEALRNRLDRPDYVIIKGAHYDDLMKRSRSDLPPSPLRSVVESVVVSGEVLADQAHLTIELRIVLSGKEPAWVPIRLDGKIPTSAREGERELPLRVVDGAWQVQVEGEGTHEIKVAVNTRVMPAPGSPEGRRLEWSIPEAATTRVQLVVGADVTEMEASGSTGLRAPLLLEPIEGGQRLRASASLAPQKRLELSWRVAAEKNTVVGPPLLTSQGEISLEIERGSMRSRSSWEVRSERGTVRQLEFRLEQADELLGLECDGRPVIAEGQDDLSSKTVTVPLSEPLRPGGITRLVVTTRRVLSAETTSRLTYRGVPLVGVVGQSGVIAISQRGGDTWVSAVAGRGLKQIDPRNELPANLRARPFTVLAFQFVEQPFDLALQIDPSAPWVQVKTRTTVTMNPGRARVDTWLDYNVPRGRIFEARISLPPEMSIDLVGPQATVASSERLGTATGPPMGKTFVVRLTPRASEDGFFSIHLSGWQEIPREGTIDIGLPEPQGAQTRGGQIALLAERGLAVELADQSTESRTLFSPAGQEPPATWPWPSDRSTTSQVIALWLRHDDSPSVVRLKTVALSRTVHETSTIEAQIEPRRLDVRQETNLQVQDGTLSSLEITVPRAFSESWEIEGAEIQRTEALSAPAEQQARFRLTLAREVVDRIQIGFRIRHPFETPLDAASLRRITLPRIVIQGVDSDVPRYRVSAEERVELKPSGPGWTEITDDSLAMPRRFVSPVRLEYSGKADAVLEAGAFALAELPRLVAARLRLISTMDPAGSLRTTAAYRVDIHDGVFVVSLPPGAVWEQARVGGEVVTEVESVNPKDNAYRIKLTSGSTTPIVVTLEYVQPLSELTSWAPPRLMAGGVVQECFWEIRIPWHLALLGSPGGWSDANRWDWSSYAFIRQPGYSAGDLASWVGIPSGTEHTPPLEAAPALHSYLFSQVGDPPALRPFIISRAALVGSCSGIVMLAGLGLILVRGWGRMIWLAIPIVGTVLAALVPFNLMLALFQSSLVGMVLVGAAAVTQRMVEARSTRPGGFGDPRDLVPSISATTSGRTPISPVISAEGSTVIRKRPGTTVDHAPTPASLSDASELS